MAAFVAGGGGQDGRERREGQTCPRSSPGGVEVLGDAQRSTDAPANPKWGTLIKQGPPRTLGGNTNHTPVSRGLGHIHPFPLAGRGPPGARSRPPGSLERCPLSLGVLLRGTQHRVCSAM